MEVVIGAERGWPAATRAEFEQAAGPDGALLASRTDVSDRSRRVDTVARRLLVRADA